MNIHQCFLSQVEWCAIGWANNTAVVLLFNAAAKGHEALALRDNNSLRYYFHRLCFFLKTVLSGSFVKFLCLPACLSSVSIHATRLMLHALHINYFGNWSASLIGRPFELHAQQTQPQPQSSPAHTLTDSCSFIFQGRCWCSAMAGMNPKAELFLASGGYLMTLRSLKTSWHLPALPLPT